MRLFFTTLLCSGLLTAAAQPKTVTQATITTKTTITALDGEQPASAIPQPTGDGPVIVRRNVDGPGETISQTFFKDNMVKTVTDNDMGRNTVIRDNKAKITTTLMEIMGNKRGFYATDEDQAAMTRQMDSLMQSRGGAAAPAANTPPVIQVFYRDETKKIAGYNCGKAVVHITRATGEVDSSVVWYNMDVKLEGLAYTGGSNASGFMSFRRTNNNNADILSRVKGFPMQYEMKMGRGRTMTVVVTKLDVDKEVKDKEFEISKEFDVKPAKDMQGPGGGMQFRIGGPGGGN